MQLVNHVLPAHWACYFIYGDDDSLDAADIATADAWLEGNYPHGAHCVDVGDDYGFVKYHDARFYGVLAADCCLFTFDVNDAQLELALS